MKILRQFTAVAAAIATFLLGGRILAQAQGGATDKTDFQNGLLRFLNSSPEQQQAGLQRFFSMDPQQQQATIQQFLNADPQLQQSVVQQAQDVIPALAQNGIPILQNPDPKQAPTDMQQRVTDSLREQLGVTNDSEWSIIQEKIAAVNKAKKEVIADNTEMMGLGGMRGDHRVGNGGGGAFQALFGQPSPELKTLQDAVSDAAPLGQLKDSLKKFQMARKAREKTLVKAQDDLRALLTSRQEAIALLVGVLD